MPTPLQIRAAVTDWRATLIDFGLPAESLTKKGTKCPICFDGDDRFSYDNKYGRGDAFCRVCGNHDGISLIQKHNGWNFQVTIKELGDYLNLEDTRLSNAQLSKIRFEKEKREYISAIIYILLAQSSDKLTESEFKTYDDHLKRIERFAKDRPQAKIQLVDDTFSFQLISGIVASRLKVLKKDDMKNEYKKLVAPFNLKEPEFRNEVWRFINITYEPF